MTNESLFSEYTPKDSNRFYSMLKGVRRVFQVLKCSAACHIGLRV